MAQAIAYWHRAGQQALGHSAHLEAISLLTTGLELLAGLPQSAERTQHELHLTLALGTALVVTKGWAAPEVERVYAQAQVLCRRGGDTSQRFSALFGLYSFANVRAHYHTARAWGEQLLALATRQQDHALLLQAHRALGDTLYWLGEFAAARTHLEQGLACYDHRMHDSQVVLYGEDAGVICCSFLGHICWFLGYPDQALQRINDALRLARACAHPFCLARALLAAIRVHKYRRDGQALPTLSADLLALATAQGFTMRAASGMIEQGWMRVQRGEGAEGIRQMQHGLANARATGSALGQAYQLASLAEAYGRVGQVDAGLHTLAEAQTVVRTQEEHFYEAEVYRLTGEFLWARAAAEHAEVEGALRQALAIARRQEAKSL
jgi:predicted ATPase